MCVLFVNVSSFLTCRVVSFYYFFMYLRVSFISLFFLSVFIYAVLFSFIYFFSIFRSLFFSYCSMCVVSSCRYSFRSVVIALVYVVFFLLFCVLSSFPSFFTPSRVLSFIPVFPSYFPSAFHCLRSLCLPSLRHFLLSRLLLFVLIWVAMFYL